MITMEILILFAACRQYLWVQECLKYPSGLEQRSIYLSALYLAIAAGNSSWGEHESGCSLWVTLPLLFQHPLLAFKEHREYLLFALVSPFFADLIWT